MEDILKRRSFVSGSAALAAAGRQLLPEACWIEQDFARAEIRPHDIVVANYAFGEMTPAAIALDRAWQAARIALYLFERDAAVAMMRSG